MDTKALDEILKVAKCTQFPFEMIDQAAAELVELKRKEVEFDAVYKLAEEINDKNVQLRTDLEEARERLGELEQAEYNYRADHDVLGDGSIEAGRAWDHMRHCGERSRAFLKAHPERKGNDMSDTKALERALNLVLENDVLCASYGGVFREAAAELADLKLELELCTNRDLVWEEHTKLTQLRAELDEARKVIEAAERIENGSCPFCGALLDHTKDCPLDKWLQAHPERK